MLVSQCGSSSFQEFEATALEFLLGQARPCIAFPFVLVLGVGEGEASANSVGFSSYKH